MGELARLQGDYTTARSRYIEAFAIAREVDERKVIAYLIEESATLSLALEKVKQAVALFGAAEDLRKVSHRAPSPVEQAEIDHKITAARTKLDDETFAAAWKQGKRMTIEQAIAYALEES